MYLTLIKKVMAESVKNDSTQAVVPTIREYASFALIYFMMEGEKFPISVKVNKPCQFNINELMSGEVVTAVITNTWSAAGKGRELKFVGSDTDCMKYLRRNSTIGKDTSISGINDFSQWGSVKPEPKKKDEVVSKSNHQGDLED